ncbi:MAG: YCF48-related protein [Terriglobia bacterium]
MPGFPKIALARMKAKPKSVAPLLGADAFQGADHPDANMLAAFVEKTLTERERGQLLDHLSQCAECREVAALTLPADEAAAEPTRVAALWRWRPGPIVRWAALAAALGTVTLVVGLRPGMRKEGQEISKMTPAPAPGENISSFPAPAPTPPLAQSPLPSTRADVPSAEKKAAGDVAATRVSPRRAEGLTQDSLKLRGQASRQMSYSASSGDRAMAKVAGNPPASADREKSQGGTATTAQALPAPSLPSAAAGESVAASGQVGKAGTGSMATVEPLAKGASHSASLGMKPSATTTVAAPAKAAPRVTAQSTSRMTAQAGIGGFRAVQKALRSGTVPPAALWNVSADGKLQRSADSGNAWQPVQVADGVTFRAVAALGNNIWVGGSDGALFRSTDAGATWARANINFEGNTVTETITGIQSSDPQHLTVTTASGAQWSSEDGGQSWQKKP